MAFVQLSGISIAFGERDILKDVTLNLSSGSRAALTGANGSGKTTLMRIMAGEIQPDSGSVIKQRDTKVSYLPQSGILHKGTTLLEEAERAFDPLRAYLVEIEDIGSRLEKIGEGSPETEGLLETLHHHQEHIQESGYYSRKEHIDEVLRGLGFQEADTERMTDEFSGGWQMRIALAKILLERPDMLLLDEPTNYLDIEARTWLEEYLRQFNGGVLVVSHDKYFLDVTVTEVAEVFNARLSRYTGNYTAYEKRRESELEILLAAYKRQQEEIARQEDFIRRFRYNASKAPMVQSRIKALNKIELIQIPESMKKIHFRFPPPPHSGKRVLTVESLTKAYGERQIFTSLSFEVEKGEKLVVVGKNGAGKTTLLRILAGKDTGADGEAVYGTGVVLGYFAQEQSEELNPALSVIEEIENVCPTSLFPKIRDMLGSFLFRGDDIHKSVAVLSGGERNRLALLKLLLRPANLLILDEPTNHLDMNSKDVLLEALKEYSGTAIFVSHDRYFIEGLATKVLELRAGEPPRLFPGNYEYYLYRSEGEGPEAPPQASAKESSAAAAPPASETNTYRSEREEAKRLKAESRRRQKREEEILERIETLEQKYRENMDRLALPEIYSDGDKVKSIKEELARNEAEQASLHAEWENLE